MDITFANFSQSAAALIREAGKAVVRVEGRGRLSASGIVWSSEGYIFTAHHVLERDSGVQVGIEGGASLASELVGRDPTTDLALIKVAEPLPAPLQLSSSEPEVGHFVFALGRPGKQIQASFGMLSSVAESWRTHSGGTVDRYLQTNVEMLPGFSGGPLIDASGHLLGLTTSALLRSQAAVLPVQTLTRVFETLRTHGKVRHAYLGVGTQPVRLPEQLSGPAGQKTGLLIISVEPGSPAEQAGLLLGDVLIGLAGEAVRGPDDLLAALTGDRIGLESSIRLVRAGQVAERSVKLAERQ